MRPIKLLPLLPLIALAAVFGMGLGRPDSGRAQAGAPRRPAPAPKADPTRPRHFRAVAVQPKWAPADYLSEASFRAWMGAQLASARPHLAPDRPNLVVLTELNGLPLVLLGARLAARAPTFQLAAALALIKHLPGALLILAREGVGPVRALQLSRAEATTRIYLDVCRDLARQYGVYLVCGTAPLPHYRLDGQTLRRDGPGLYNQAVVLDPNGDLIGTADKVHLTPDEEQDGVDLTPGDLDDLRVFPTEVGDLGVATSLDAFHPDVIGRLEAQGATVLLQPDANGSAWTAKEGLAPDPEHLRDQPKAWLDSAWQAVQHSSTLRYAINPMCVGNLFDLSFDGQSAIVARAEEAPEPRAYALTDPRPGFLALAPWVADGPADQLRALGRALSAHSGDPRENQYHQDVLSADLRLPPSRVAVPALTTHEQALRAYLSGQASLPDPAAQRLAGVLWPLAWLALALWPGRRFSPGRLTVALLGAAGLLLSLT